jgi:hypothetical protein
MIKRTGINHTIGSGLILCGRVSESGVCRCVKRWTAELLPVVQILIKKKDRKERDENLPQRFRPYRERLFLPFHPIKSLLPLSLYLPPSVPRLPPPSFPSFIANIDGRRWIKKARLRQFPATFQSDLEFDHYELS